jgi:tetratricopeptide (TPR) repeat protein
VPPYELPKSNPDTVVPYLVARRCWTVNADERPRADQIVDDLSSAVVTGAFSATRRPEDGEKPKGLDSAIGDGARTTEPRGRSASRRTRTLAEEVDYLRSTLPPADPDPEKLFELAVALRQLYRHSKDAAAVEEAILHLDVAIQASNSVSESDCQSYAHELGLALTDRFNLTRRSEDLDRAITLHRQVLELRKPGHPQRAISLFTLAVTILEKSDSSLRTLIEATGLLRNSIRLLPKGRERAQCWILLINVLLREAKILLVVYRSAIYEEVGEIYSKLLDDDDGTSMSAAYLDHNECLKGLADALEAQYRFSSRPLISTLDRAINLRRDHMNLTSEEHGRAQTLGNLANVLYQRVSRRYDLNLLDECISSCDILLKLLPRENYGYRKARMNLINALNERLRHEEDIAAWRKAAALSGQGTLNRVSFLLNWYLLRWRRHRPHIGVQIRTGWQDFTIEDV